MLQHRHNNSRALDGPIRLADNVGRMMSKVEDTYEMWFRVWRDTWVPKLMRAPKWFNGTVDLETGDLVYFQRTASELGHNSDRWVVGKVSKIERGKDGKVRRVWIQYKNFNENTFQVTERSARSVIKIFSLLDSSVQEDLLEVQRYMKDVLGSQFVEYATQGGSWKYGEDVKGFNVFLVVIDRYGNFHLTDTDTDIDMLIITYTDTDTDMKKRNSPIPILIRRKRNSLIPMLIQI